MNKKLKKILQLLITMVVILVLLVHYDFNNVIGYLLRSLFYPFFPCPTPPSGSGLYFGSREICHSAAITIPPNLILFLVYLINLVVFVLIFVITGLVLDRLWKIMGEYRE